MFKHPYRPFFRNSQVAVNDECFYMRRGWIFLIEFSLHSRGLKFWMPHGDTNLFIKERI